MSDMLWGFMRRVSAMAQGDLWETFGSKVVH